MARRKGSPRLSPEELERMRNDPGRVYRDTFRPAPGRGVPDNFVPRERDRGSDLDRYRELIGRLEGSRGSRGGATTRRPADLVDRRGKTRKGRDSGNSRSYEDRKAEADRRQAEYSANQDRYRGDFESSGGLTQQVVVPWYNPETGARWSAPNPGYKPKEGTGWVKGYGPKNDAASNKPVASAKETPTKGSKFEAMLRGRMRKF